MKRTVAFLVAAAFLAGTGVCAGGDWALRGSGGPGWISPDDLNAFLRDYVRSHADESGSPARGPGFKTIGRSGEFELALFIPVETRLHLLASFGALRASATGNAFSMDYPAVAADYARDDRIRTYFVRLGAMYCWPVSGRVSVNPYAAAEGYWSTFEDSGSWSFKSLSTGDRVLWMDWTERASAFNSGFSLGVEIEVGLFPSARLSVDAGFRRARLTGFKGDVRSTWNYPGGSSSEDKKDVVLYYYEYAGPDPDLNYGTLNLPDIWGGRRLNLFREAILDLSGPYLKAGIKISF
jgi:hypothetical protein